MARPLRIEYPHALYHITARGNERKRIKKTIINFFFTWALSRKDIK